MSTDDRIVTLIATTLGIPAERVTDDLAFSETAEWDSLNHVTLVMTLEEEMKEAAADLRFEYAARLRDEIKDLKRELREAVG